MRKARVKITNLDLNESAVKTFFYADNESAEVALHQAVQQLILERDTWEINIDTTPPTAAFKMRVEVTFKPKPGWEKKS